MNREQVQGCGNAQIMRHPSAVGVPLADYLTGTSSCSPREVEDPVDWTLKGRKLQAQAMGELFIRLGRALRALFIAAWTLASQRYRARAAIEQLNRLDDHLLQDLGIRRAEIPLVVQGRARASGATLTAEDGRRTAEATPQGTEQDRLAA